MLKGFSISYSLSLILYFSVAISGYFAFGTNVHQNLFLSVGKPSYVIIVANLMVFFHVVAAYQVFSMPVFEWFLNTLGKKLTYGYFFRTVYRGVYVLAGTLVAVSFPFFAAMNGLVGAIGIAMITFIIPFVMLLVVFDGQLTCKVKFVIILVIVMMGALACLASAGALYNIYVQLVN
eukprot:TRINITY_DN8203_c1_g1_i1.p2 TRINITY_DN8203_c1_g1~~TRINITY_DN8203_c1_g1_i1.p2  ORF type:complete len:177 (+),score=24.99 TRINITY_DN8203_c1_g1_i1:2-532(+)